MTANAAVLPVAVYLLNYALLVPRMFFRDRKFGFFLSNIVIVLVAVFIPVLFMDFPEDVDIDQLEQQLNGIKVAKLLVGTVILRIMLYVCMITLSVGMRYVTRWYEDRKKLEEERRRNTEAELVWLKNQLNPHFLFNTLNNISSLVTVDAEKAQESICQLSDLLRYALYESNAAKVKVRDEVGFMRNYIDLMSIRCNAKTRIEVRFDEFEESAQISPLLFISLVENAFKHGTSAHLDSFVKIDMGMDGRDLVFSCENSIAERHAENYSGSGVGLENIRRRLELLYPSSHSYLQYTEDGIYIVIVRIKNVKANA
jgi:LytS/YehU family sensor histidine kinase